MDQMVAARYAPLVFPHPLNALPGGELQKYLRRFNGQGENTVEEHWEAFLSYDDNQNIEAKDSWMRMFVQSLDGDGLGSCLLTQSLSLKNFVISS